MTRFDVSSLCNFVFWGVVCPCTSFSACQSVFEVVAAVWALAVAQVIVFAASAVVFVLVIGCNVAAGLWVSGLERSGCGVCGSGVARPGVVWRRFCGFWVKIEVGVVVVVCDDNRRRLDAVWSLESRAGVAGGAGGSVCV